MHLLLSYTNFNSIKVTLTCILIGDTYILEFIIIQKRYQIQPQVKDHKNLLVNYYNYFGVRKNKLSRLL